MSTVAPPLPLRADRWLQWRLRIGFVTMPMIHSIGANIVTFLALRFLTDNLAVSAALAGSVFAIAKVYDGVLDPALGAYSDRLRSRWGRRLPFVFLGSAIMPIAIVLLFNVPAGAPTAVILGIVFVALVLQATAYSALTVPGIAILTESTDDYHERSTMMSFRVVGNSFGALLGSTVPAWLLAYWGATTEGHGRMAWVIGGILAVLGAATSWLLYAIPRTDPPAGQERFRFGAQLRMAWDNVPFRTLAIVHIFVLFGVTINSVSAAYFFKYVVRLGDAFLGTYLMISTAMVVCSMPLWLFVTRRLGKKAGYIAALATYALVKLTWLFADGNPLPLLWLRGAISGTAAGGIILLAYSMLTDTMRYDHVKTGLRREGAFAGFTSLMDQLSAAGSIAVLGSVLGAMGYVASKSAGTVPQPASAITGIELAFIWGPVAALGIAILGLRHYRLTERDLPAVLDEGEG